MQLRFVLGVLCAGCAWSPALAADQLKFGPVPSWVVPNAIPATGNAPAEAPFATLLSDQQFKFEDGKSITFTESAVKIQSGQGLSLGNLSLAWDPATDTVTIHKVHIRRGGEVIDVLARGQTFTTVRREANLEMAALDGRLTANIQPEGLQVGDVIDLAVTFEHSDPTFKSHVEATFAGWNGIPVKAARARLLWPSTMKLAFRQSPNLPQARRSSANGLNVLELSSDNVQPLVAPKLAPLRFSLGRIAETTNFASWAELANSLQPYFQQAAVIPKSGPLRDEVERIRTQYRDPRARTEQALALVQDRVRYVALLMGEGGYVPASAEATWSRRFGDCKAKTALLLAMLREYGVEADAVVVNATIGDAISDRLPMLALFNHVIVRARLGGQTYWLDGTRTDDSSLDSIEVPDFRWGLPLVANATLVPINPPPLARPTVETNLTIDAHGGLFAKAPTVATRSVRGDLAGLMQQALARLSPAQSDEFLRDYWVNTYKFVTIKSATSSFDKAKSELKLSMTGDAKLDWDDGYLYIPESSIGYDQPIERSPGPNSDAPVAVDYPVFNRAHVEIRLPPGFAATQKTMPDPVKATLSGIEYSRTMTRNGDTLILDKSERSIVPEISYKQALADMPRLKALSDEEIYIRATANYRATAKDLDAQLEQTPGTPKALLGRGMLMVQYGRFDEAITDLGQVLKTDPKNVTALIGRGTAYAWQDEVKKAEQDFAAAEAVSADTPGLAAGRALLAERTGDFRAAIDGFSKVLKKEPNQAFSLYHRANSYKELGDNTKALADSDAALKAGYKAPDLRLMRANIFRNRGDRAAANREADALVADNPGMTYAWVAAARIYAANADRSKAMAAYDRAIAIAPEAYIYVNRAQNRPDSDAKAKLADLDEALRLEPDNADALAEKAAMVERKGRPAEAVTVYDAILQIEKSAASANRYRSLRAIALYRLGKRDEAQKVFQDLRSQASAALDFNNLCWTKATANILLESALEDCNEALKRSPGNGPYLDSLGLVLLRLGRLDQALKAYDQAIVLRTGSSSLMGRAFVHLAKGDRAKAEVDAAEARKSDADIDATYAGYGLTFPGRIDAAASH